MQDSFEFFVDISNIEKGKSKDGRDVMKLGGIASTSAMDSDGEVLDPNGFDTTYFENYGFVNWHHQSKKSPASIVGEPTKVELTPKGLYVETTLYDSQTAKEVFDLAQTLKKSSKSRRLGYSVEGKAVERDPLNEKVIRKANITGLAITHMPKNPHTLADIVKGESGEGKEGRCWDGYMPVPGKEPYSEGSCQKKKSKNDELDKDLSANDSGAPLKKESVDGNLKQNLTKAEVFAEITKRVPDITKFNAQRLYDFITQSTNPMKNGAPTNEDIEKAFNELGIETNLEGEVDEIEKAIAEKEKEAKELKKSLEDKKTKMEKGKEKGEEKGEVEKSEDDEDMDKGADGGQNRDGRADGDNSPSGSNGDISKANGADDLSGSAEVDFDIIKSMQDTISGQSDQIASLETQIIGFQEKELESQKNQAVIMKGLYDSLNDLRSLVEKMSEEPQTSRKSIAREQVHPQHQERFEKGHNGDFNAQFQLSESSNRQQVRKLLEDVTFEKGESPDPMYAQALQGFEAGSPLPQQVKARLLSEKGVKIS